MSELKLQMTGPRAALDPEIQAELDKALDAKNVQKESAVKHKRHWVRLTRLCNQRCIFCLDSWNQNGTYVDTEQLYQYIDLGANLGRERLILSGGEPTIHPDYIKFIRRGRKAGYDWIQTVTNAMMFAYPEFARRAIHAGLDEVTVSIHGHTPRLQDKLVGVKGAFKKGVEGIRNIQALSKGRTVVNVDIVINKQNVAYLREIIDYFRKLGIHEFDLLYIVPFGRGFSEYRRQLYFDIDDHFDDLQRAFEVSRDPGVYLWTNRLPPQHLENYEDLIQDPHKLHSEIQGGLHNFEGFMKMGIAPDCHGERCDYCFLKGLCHDHMFAYRQRLVDGTFDHVTIDLAVEPASQRAQLVMDKQRPQTLSVQGTDAAQIESYLQSHPYRSVEHLTTLVEPSATDALKPLLQHADVDHVIVRGVDGLQEALSLDPSDATAAIELMLDGDVVAWMVENRDAISPWIESDRLIGHLPNFEYMSAVKANGVSPEEISTCHQLGLRLKNVPGCLGGEKALEGDHYVLSRPMVDAQGNLGVTPYVQRYIEGEYYKKSLRCNGCALSDACRGMHISFLRTYGFSTLKPIDPSSQEEAA